LTNGTGRSLNTIELAQLRAGSAPVSSSAGFELLCTYNWVSTPSPTIYVPGSPARWNPVTFPVTLPKDSGTHFIDQNASRAPTYPFEPMFAALDLMKPDFDFGGVDLVTNRNSLRKLLHFTSGRAPDSFRIDVNLVESTLFLTRRERRTEDVIQGAMNAGYGHNFERAFTKPLDGLEDSSGHHRVARYRIGELNCVVRFEVDAWDGGEGTGEERIETHDSGSKDAAGTSDTSGSLRDGDVLAGFMKLSLSEGPSSTPSVQLRKAVWKDAENKLRNRKHDAVGESTQRKKEEHFRPTRVVRRGHLVPCSTLAEIKTKKRMVRLAEALPQLWFGRTPLLLHATHTDGMFAGVERINAGERFEAWEKQQQAALQKMVSLIGLLRDIAKEAKDGACVIVCKKEVRPLTLQVLESTVRQKVLPGEIVERYWREATIPSTS
jgi:hypothetical protein